MSIFSGTASNSEHYKNSVKRSLPFLFRTHARLSLARVSSTFLSWSEIWVVPTTGIPHPLKIENDLNYT